MDGQRRTYWLRAALVGGTFLGLILLERRRPLRRAVEPKLRREGRNLAMAGLSAVAVHLAETPITTRLTRQVQRRRWGLLKRLPLPQWLETLLAVVLLDYTLYVWHVLTHRVPFLWRFHQVHHIDLDLDTSTGVRFHFGEMSLTAALRAVQILGIGVDRPTLAFWQRLLTLSVIFHHSNLRLPAPVERRLSPFIVTPRMHGVHHSESKDESDSNFASLLSIWDFLHGTWRSSVPQRAITIGIPGRRDPGELTLGPLLAMPFRPQRPSWPAQDEPRQLGPSPAF